MIAGETRYSLFVKQRFVAYLLVGIVLAGSARGADKLIVDGQFDDVAWQAALPYANFSMTQPFTGQPSIYRTEARIVSLPEGLAIAFRCDQPADIPHLGPPRARDAMPMGSDLVYAIIDFDGTGSRAYEFAVGLGGTQRDAVIANENHFSYDWDGRWYSAVRDDEDGWQVEILIPWSTVAMRQSREPEREIAVQLGRYVESRGERSAWPAISFDRARFVSELQHVRITSYNETRLDVVPYISERYDLLTHRASTNGGVDVLWKPSGYMQVAAALNPDFGQVEADDLVVNFDAIEVFRSDKRPFFTENSGLFDLRVQHAEGARLLYTRRVGGFRDDGSASAAEIDGALKVTGSAAGLDYGALVVQEADAVGKSFAAARALYPTSAFSVGYLGTFVDRPVLNRQALVNVIDWRAMVSPKFSMDGLLIGSTIDTVPTVDAEHGFGASLRGVYTASKSMQTSLTTNYFDETLDFDDFGYMPRNNHLQVVPRFDYRATDYPDDSFLASHSWVVLLDYRANAAGDPLRSQSFVAYTANRRAGGRYIAEWRYDPPGVDDLISRGNGDVNRHARFDFWQALFVPRIGKWSATLGTWFFEEGYEKRAFQFEADISYQLADRFDLSLKVYPLWSRDWLIWREDNLLASYRRTQVISALQLNWLPSQRHEFRIKTQWLVIDAHDGTSYRIDGNGGLTPSQEFIPNLAVSSFGVQLRYRYELAPQRDLYIVYARGGFAEDEHDRSAFGLINDATSLRDADQALIKMRWRF